MIIVKLWGGIGNQLFQYAFGYSIAKKHGEDLFFDIDFYANQSKHLDKRAIKLQLLNIKDLKIIPRPKEIKIFEKPFTNHLFRFFKIKNFTVKSSLFFVKEVLRNGEENFYKKNATIYYDGYWQSSKYFSNYRNEILKMFSFKGDFDSERINLNNEIALLNSVAIHIRRSDILKRNGLKNIRHDLPASYYYDAINLMKEKVDNPVFYIFSDDIIWAKAIFSNCSEDIRFVEIQDADRDIADLISISKCRHGIMSASTYSWWGNWLRKESGVVVGPSGNHFNKCFFETNWILIDYEK